MNRDPVQAGLTADEIPVLLRVSKGSVYRRAHLYRWSHNIDVGRACRHPGDVTATLDQLDQGEDNSAAP